jgi:hypothetical protein
LTRPSMRERRMSERDYGSIGGTGVAAWGLSCDERGHEMNPNRGRGSNSEKTSTRNTSIDGEGDEVARRARQKIGVPP